MLRRVGIFALIAFQALWLNVILPGHTRGQIALPGAYSTSTERCEDCEAKPAKAPAKTSTCAICYFAATLTPPLIVAELPKLAYLQQADRFIQAKSISVDRIDVYFGRAPPADA